MIREQNNALLSKTEKLDTGHNLMSTLRNKSEINAVPILKNKYNINIEEWMWVHAMPILNGTECSVNTEEWILI